MATSSIFKDFVLEDQESTDDFLEILLEAEEKKVPHVPTKVKRLRGEELDA